MKYCCPNCGSTHIKNVDGSGYEFAKCKVCNLEAPACCFYAFEFPKFSLKKNDGLPPDIYIEKTHDEQVVFDLKLPIGMDETTKAICRQFPNGVPR